MDGYVQYVDFLTYLHNVLFNENSILYTFSKTLGGSNIAVFSYYLSSPFNLLLLLFSNLQIHSFFNLVVALKLSLASTAFAYFSVNRFTPKSVTIDNGVIFIALAMGYGLGQYSLAQASNIMWLDGVYMLPFMMLQCFYLTQGIFSFKLSIIVGLTIIFNWYTAAIDCLYSAFYFATELILATIAKKYVTTCILKISLRYFLCMILGIMLSAILFLPTLGGLNRSASGNLDVKAFADLSLLGELPSFIQKYTYGATSQLGSVALFCGSLALVLAVFSIVDRHIHTKKKIILLILMVISFAFVYWHPFYTLFSLIKKVYSYDYRYSYIAIFTLLFLSHVGNDAFIKIRQAIIIKSIAIGFALLLLVLFYIKHVNERVYVYATAFFVIFEVILFLSLKERSQKKIHLKPIAVVFMFVAALDMVINANALLKIYSAKNVSAYKDYRQKQDQLLTTIRNKDSSFFRISQTSNLATSKDTRLSHNYNEALSFNYASVSGYTSAPDDNQRFFLNNVGYRIGHRHFNITNTSILATDSLLGVKYLLSDHYIKGYEELTKLEHIPKTIYQNPFVFPMAFVYHSGNNVTEYKNPFEYQNSIFKKLFGITDNLYVPIKYVVQGAPQGKKLRFTLDTTEFLKFPVYGNLPWNGDMNASLNADGTFITRYAGWLSPSVFYIPCSDRKRSCVLEANADNLTKFKMDETQFYALDLARLAQCNQIANDNKASFLKIENGFVEAHVHNATVGDRLFLSVAEDNGWEISVNGKNAKYELIGNCLYGIELYEGDNIVRMQYHVKYLKAGFGISAIALLILLVIGLKLRITVRKKN